MWPLSPSNRRSSLWTRQTQNLSTGLFLMLGLVAFAQAAAGGGVRAFFNVYLDRELFVSTALIGGILGAGQLVPLYVALMTRDPG